MPNTFGGKIVLEGEQQYRQALKEISSDFSMLRSEMIKNTAEFDKNDKSVEALTARNKGLSEQIEKQKEKIEILKAALVDSIKNFGENSKETEKWQKRLNYAEADLTKMETQLGKNEKALDGTSKETDKNSKSLDKFGNSADEAGKKTSAFGDMLKANLTAEAIKSSLHALVESIKSVANVIGGAVTEATKFADDILTLSVKTGVSTKSLQEFSAVAELIDVDLNTFTSTLTKNIKSMSDAANGSKNASRAYAKLGISITDSSGNLRNSEEVFWQAIDALGSMENATERDAIAMQIFGKSAQELNPLIAQGSKGMAKMTEQAEKMGAVLSDEALQSLGSLDDAMHIWNGTMTGLTRTISVALAPALTEIVNAASDAAAAMGGFIRASLSGASPEEVERKYQEFVKSVDNLISVIEAKLPEMLDIGGKVIGVLWEGISRVLPSLLPEIARWGVIIAAGFVAWSVLIAAAISAWPVTLFVALSGALALFWPKISKLFSDIWSGLSGFIGNLWVQIKGFLGEHWDDLLLWIFAWPVALIKTLSDFWPQLSSFLSNLWANISSWFSQTFANIKNWWSQISSNAGENSKKVINTIIDWFNQIPQKIWDSIIGAVSKVTQWGSQMASSAKTAANNVWNSIVNTLSGLPSKMVSIGGDLVRGLWNGISNVTGWLTNKIKGFANGVMDTIKSWFGISSPSKLMRDEVGKNLALGLGEGFTDEMKDISKEMARAVPTDFDSSINQVLSRSSLDSSGIGVLDRNGELNRANGINSSSVGVLDGNDGLHGASGNSLANGFVSMTSDELVSALQNALAGMAFKVDGDKIGELVVNQVERAVYS